MEKTAETAAAAALELWSAEHFADTIMANRKQETTKINTFIHLSVYFLFCASNRARLRQAKENYRLFNNERTQRRDRSSSVVSSGSAATLPRADANQAVHMAYDNPVTICHIYIFIFFNLKVYIRDLRLVHV